MAISILLCPHVHCSHGAERGPEHAHAHLRSRAHLLQELVRRAHALAGEARLRPLLILRRAAKVNGRWMISLQFSRQLHCGLYQTPCSLVVVLPALRPTAVDARNHYRHCPNDSPPRLRVHSAVYGGSPAALWTGGRVSRAPPSPPFLLTWLVYGAARCGRSRCAMKCWHSGRQVGLTAEPLRNKLPASCIMLRVER